MNATDRANIDIFTPYALGTLQLKNRIVMAPLTRSRAVNKPNPATYYGGGAEGYIDYPTLEGAPTA